MVKTCLHDNGKGFDDESLECCTRDEQSGEVVAREACKGLNCPKWTEGETRHVDE